MQAPQEAVGTLELQTLNGTGRPVHGGDVIVMVTNGGISGPARDFARQQRLHLVDRRVLEQWAPGRATAVGDPSGCSTAPEASTASLSSITPVGGTT